MLATVETIEQTSDACPAQWEGKLTDGRTFYIRYRWGYLTFRVSEKPTDNIKLAVKKGYPGYQQEYYYTQYKLRNSNPLYYPKGSCMSYKDLIPALYQTELQDWLREEHGVEVSVNIDETLSYYWSITPMHPKASIMQQQRSHDIWCGHYHECLESGLYTALKLL